MNLKKYDNKCVRIITKSGEVFEGTVSYDSREYAFHEYGYDKEALHLTPIIFFEDEILSVISLEEVDGPFGHYSEKYGLLEKMCLEWGADMIEEVFDSEDDIQILRMLECMSDNFQSLADRAVPGMAPWRRGTTISKSKDETVYLSNAEDDETRQGPVNISNVETDESGQGPVYLGELQNMLRTLVKYNNNSEIINKARGLLEKLAACFPDENP